MNKYYSLIGIGLLSAATLTSCQEDVILEEANNNLRKELRTYTTSADIQGYESAEKDKEQSTRANVQDNGKSFFWNTGDKVTVWDGNNGYAFTADGDNLNENPTRKVTFTGEAALTDGAKVWGVYPANETATPLVFNLAATAVQETSGKPALQQTMCMLAEGTVNGTTVTNLVFHHLTALYQFVLTNKREAAITIKSVKVEADSEVFPTRLSVTSSEAPVYTYAEKKAALELTMPEIAIQQDESVTGYMSFFPTEGLTGDTELTFSVVIATEGEGGVPVEEIIEVKKAQVSALYSKPGAQVPTKGYEAGKRYVINLNVLPEGGNDGYIQEGNNYSIYTEAGLTNLSKIPEAWANENANFILKNDLDMSGQEAWTPITNFRGTLDGDNKAISNLSFVTTGTDGLGLFILNSGTIKNLVLKDANVNYGYQLGLIAAENAGTITNCTVNGATLTISGGTDKRVGTLVGINQANGIIEDCTVEGTVAINISSTHTAGGIVGENNGTIKGASVGSGVSLTNNSTGDLGGIVGYMKAGMLEGCYSSANIRCNATTAISMGGLIGSAWGSTPVTVTGCYAAADITTSSNAGWCTVGGIIGQGGGVITKTLTGCYSTTTFSGRGAFGSITKGATNFICTTCYFVSGNSATSDGDLAGTTKVTAEELKAKADEMNAATSSSKYQFVAGTTDKEPLLIEKKP